MGKDYIPQAELAFKAFAVNFNARCYKKMKSSYNFLESRDRMLKSRDKFLKSRDRKLFLDFIKLKQSNNFSIAKQGKKTP
ncbi:MAG: hypothetical protein LBR17_04810 [Bacteroidales bacterium]|jgi:hypothetical protein|nr:hypothetical protein [Bacteroidales bacterium]